MIEIIVEPLGDAWAVRADGAEPQLFTRGSLAESTAKAIATRLADAGEQVEIHIMLRDGRRGARFVCLPPLSDKEPPLLVGGTTLNHAIEAVGNPRMGAI